MGTRIRLLIADDHPFSRKGLRALLSTCPTVEVVCEAKNGQEAVRLVETYRPDLVLMDIQMPVCDGLEATRRIKATMPEVKVIILTIREASQADAMSAGADAFLLKGSSTRQLLAAIECHRATESEPQALEEGAQKDPPTAPRLELQRKRLATASLTP
jgi:DNA-binding NarL/FixJ family response regulator